MKVIIVNETELRGLLDRLELEKLLHRSDMTPEAFNAWEAAHRTFHYQVTTWIQEIGGSGVR